MVPTHNQVYLDGLYVSDDTMKSVQNSQNLHLLTFYDTESEAHVSIMGAVSLTREASNTAITALRDQFAAPRNLLIPFVGVDRNSANISIGAKFISPQHLVNQLLFEIGAKNARVAFDNENFTLQEVLTSANVVFANAPHKLDRFVTLYNALKSVKFSSTKKGLR